MFNHLVSRLAALQTWAAVHLALRMLRTLNKEYQEETCGENAFQCDECDVIKVTQIQLSIVSILMNRIKFYDIFHRDI